MEIINRKTLSIKRNPPKLNIKLGKLYFNVEAVNAFKLKPNEYIHFIKEGKTLFFIANDEEDGFKLTGVDKKRHIGLDIASRPLVRYIVNNFEVNVGDSLKLIETANLHKGYKVIEVKK